MDFIGLVWLFPVIMATAAAINGFGCRKLGKVAGAISVAAMASTFVLATLVFFQVRSLAHSAHGEGHEGAAHEAAPAAEAHGENPSLAYWHGLKPEQQAAMKSQYLFVKATIPEHPQPWETSVRGGLGGHVPLYTWMDIPATEPGGRSLKVDMAMHVDQLTAIFLMFISFVGSLVFFYATGYMIENHDGHEVVDPGYARFFSYLALFAASMYTLILGSNFIVMFIGWEGVGLCSYLLIGYYFDRPFNDKLSCADAGKKAFVANRVGDFGLMLGTFLIFWGIGTVDFQEVIHAITIGEVPAGFMYSGALITSATLLLFLGATGKSAQIPLFVWLPDAMAGPTPVSALIHAATMVTAGVYMVARLNVLFMFSPATLTVIAVVGGLTAFVAAFVGLTQRGIKKILAYSTVSQLGYMFLAMGVGSFAAGIFHVFTHAFFKACLFLAAGSIIHALHHEEDVFKMGGLYKKMFLTALAYGLATLAIAGIPPFAGFWSKDEILYMTFVAGQGSGLYMFLYVLGLITAAFTAFYMGRSFFLAFTGHTRLPHGHDHGHDHHDHGHDDHDHGHDDHGHGDDHGHHAVPFDKVHESPFALTSVILVLGLCSVLVGFLNVPKGLLPLGEMNGAFHHFLAPVTDRGALTVAEQVYHATETEETGMLGPIIVGDSGKQGEPNWSYEGPEVPLALLSILIAAGSLGFAWLLYGAGDLKKSERLARIPGLNILWNISWKAWKWDDLYTMVFIRGAMRTYKGVLWADKNVIDGTVVGTGRAARGLGLEFRRLQNGQVQVYGLVMFIGVCLFLLYFALGMGSFIGDANIKTPIRRAAKNVPAAVVQVPAN